MWCDEFLTRVAQDRDLRDLTTVRIGGRARFFAQPSSDDDLGSMLRAMHAEKIDHRVLGGGSNVLLPDGELKCAVIHPVSLQEFEVEGEEIRVGAGHSLSSLVARANDAGLAGVHTLSGIPGQVGGAVVMNAGGRYGEIGSVVRQVRVRLGDGSPAEFSRDDMQFAYRSSNLPEGAVVTSVRLALKATADARSLRRESGRIIKEKNAAQPTTSRTFGCMFRNPEGRSAGLLIQEAGLKGTTRGGACISNMHGNFIENLGNAIAEDVCWLMELAERTVQNRFGVTLRREVCVWPQEPSHA